MSKKGDYKIPFDARGNMMTYEHASTYGYKDTVTGELFVSGMHYSIPADGSWCDYLSDGVRERMSLPTCRTHPVEWRDNHTFEDTLRYDGYGRGRSAADITLKSTTSGAVYSMFLTDFDALMKCIGFPVAHGTVGAERYDGVNATWTFVKRGQNYGIRLADEV